MYTNTTEALKQSHPWRVICRRLLAVQLTKRSEQPEHQVVESSGTLSLDYVRATRLKTKASPRRNRHIVKQPWQLTGSRKNAGGISS